MTTELPRIVCFKSAYNNKFLRYRYEDVQTQGLLEFSGENVKDPYVQFEVEKAKSSSDLVHIKSRYNNKYLVRWSPSHYWISAIANAPDEDQTDWNCTLFRVIVDDPSNKTIRLVHTQLGSYVRLEDAGDPFNSCMFAESNLADGQNMLDVLIVIDWESIFTLPKRVAFMGDNNQYLGAVTFNDEPGLQFSFKDVRDPKVAHQIISFPDGLIFVKSEYYGKFWRAGSESWVAVDGEDPEWKNTSDSIFRLISIDMNVVALINFKETKLIKRYSSEERESSLATTTTTKGFTTPNFRDDYLFWNDFLLPFTISEIYSDKVYSILFI